VAGEPGLVGLQSQPAAQAPAAVLLLQGSALGYRLQASASEYACRFMVGDATCIRYSSLEHGIQSEFLQGRWLDAADAKAAESHLPHSTEVSEVALKFDLQLYEVGAPSALAATRRQKQAPRRALWTR